MKAVVLLNVAAGAPAADPLAGKVEEAFARTRVRAEVRAVEPAGVRRAVLEAAASDAGVIVVGGGDGTLSTAAQVLVGSRKTLGILPLGTLNHFARDLGVPGDLEDAVRTIEAGCPREIDVGDANGRVFLNNCSIGIYPQVVKGREELRQRSGGGKWLAMLLAALTVLRRFPLVRVTLRVDDRESTFATPFVFVGNNRYDVSLLALGRRDRVDAGQLGVYFSRSLARMGLLRLTILGLLGRLEQDRDFRSFQAPGLEVDTRRKRLRVAVDGELTTMAPPLRFRSRPRALRVLVPPPEAPSAP
jgi:diacylglycerol kinase family enzyme